MAPFPARRARVLPTGTGAAIPNFAGPLHPYHAPMRTVGTLVGALVTFAGLVWLAQGLNLPFAPRSFMTADRVWAFIGLAAVVGGAILIWSARRGR